MIGALAFAYVGPSMMSFEGRFDSQYAEAGVDVSKFVDTRIQVMQSSAWRSFMLIGLSALILYGYIKEKLSKKVLIILLGLLAVGDLMQINQRYISSDDFVTAKAFKNNFPKTPADEQILKDSDPHYRVFSTGGGNPWSSSTTSYYHKSIGGMHAAKLQRYDDMISRHLSQGNQAAFDMLNTKYFIVEEQQGRPVAQRNGQACGNAWFVNEIELVNSANDEIAALNDLAPLSTAIVHKEFSNYINGFSPTKNGSISLTSYAPNRLEYTCNTTSEQLAVFSEVWYGPDKGWQAYIDGQPVDHIRANYILRALKIPSGSHSIAFEFSPKTYQRGNIIGLICSLMILGALGFLVYRSWGEKELSD